MESIFDFMKSLIQQCGPRLYAVKRYYENRGDAAGWDEFLGRCLASGAVRLRPEQARLIGDDVRSYAPAFEEELW